MEESLSSARKKLSLAKRKYKAVGKSCNYAKENVELEEAKEKAKQCREKVEKIERDMKEFDEKTNSLRNEWNELLNSVHDNYIDAIINARKRYAKMFVQKLCSKEAFNTIVDASKSKNLPREDIANNVARFITATEVNVQ